MPDIIVKNQAELDAALKAAVGGETIKLAAGSYTSITVMTKAYASTVTIQSLDTANPVDVKMVFIGNSNNVTVKDVVAATDYKPPEDYMRLNGVIGSKNVVLDNVKFSGGTGDVTLSKGAGLFVRNSTNVTMKNSSIDHFGLGLEVLNVDGLVVQNNSFHDNRRDHTNFAEVNNLLIDGNTFTNLFPVGTEHPDAIQFLTAGKTKGSTNVTISNNIIMQGAGSGAQGIFMNDEVGTLPYVNLNIKNNLIYLNGLYHGINVVNGQNVNIESNTVISKSDTTSFWIRLDKTNGATVKDNVTDLLTVTASSSNIVASNNRTLASDAVTLRKLYGLNDDGKARLADLIIEGIGYRPPAGSAAAALVASELAAMPQSSPSLLLDLNFGKNGAVDQSHWNSSTTSKAVDLTAISGNKIRVQTGTGVELDRFYSRQIYSLSAFTLSFDLQRSSVTSPAGQILGIHQSWSVSLRADGELTFTMRNAAGVSQTLVTSGAKLIDTLQHKIALTYDSARGSAILYVDGVQRGSAAMSGVTRPTESWGLYVGSPFSAAFTGTVGDIEIREGAASASQILAQVASTSADPASAVKFSLSQGAVSQAAALLVKATSSNTSAANVATVGSTLAQVEPVPAYSALVGKTAASLVSTAGDLSSRALTKSMLLARSEGFQMYHA